MNDPEFFDIQRALMPSLETSTDRAWVAGAAWAIAALASFAAFLFFN